MSIYTNPKLGAEIGHSMKMKDSTNTKHHKRNCTAIDELTYNMKENKDHEDYRREDEDMKNEDINQGDDHKDLKTKDKYDYDTRESLTLTRGEVSLHTHHAFE
ncbi:hypothetical protein GOP47_0005538 [Adiantum capillus-veneris]|uniref:Uncharacterized protein n=1 Tax=Adiantum capillus-veneris TaxID=13818 RepID=A0A9D4V5R4_ADICA|nr:hypothetical protein GOP47_0005538 [Adiantum capillus-veneris]